LFKKNTTTNIIDNFSTYMDTSDIYELKYITLRLNANDRRFGFSIIGGHDELMSPEIEDISPGMRHYYILTINSFTLPKAF
jgi:hypothetical protein